jgi:hypothetical protein
LKTVVKTGRITHTYLQPKNQPSPGWTNQHGWDDCQGREGTLSMIKGEKSFASLLNDAPLQTESTRRCPPVEALLHFLKEAHCRRNRATVPALSALFHCERSPITSDESGDGRYPRYIADGIWRRSSTCSQAVRCSGKDTMQLDVSLRRARQKLQEVSSPKHPDFSPSSLGVCWAFTWISCWQL